MAIKVLLLLVVIGYACVYAQDSENSDAEEILSDRAKTPCTTANNREGYCLSMSRCRKRIRNINRFKNPRICYFRGQVPHICCPISTNASPNKVFASQPGNSVQKPSPIRITTRKPNTRIRRSRVDINPPGCGQRIFVPPPDASFVVGGHEAEKYSWPWMVAIRIKTYDDHTGFLCGGSLITSRHVLSAAHCFDQITKKERVPSDYKLVLGAHLRSSGSANSLNEEEGVIVVTASDIKLHGGYDDVTKDNDVAVITLDKDVEVTERVRPVCLPTRGKPQNNPRVTVTGWGDTSFGGVGSKTLQEATFKVVGFRDCRHRFEQAATAMKITENMICAGDLTGKKDSCQNDSGGPLLADNEQNIWTQVGIVSFGINCAEVGFPGVYTRVANLTPWIRRQVRNS